MKRMFMLIVILLMLPVFPVYAEDTGFVSLYMGENASVLDGVGESRVLSVYGCLPDGSRERIDNSELSWNSSDNQVIRINEGIATAVNKGSFSVISAEFVNPDGTVLSGGLVMHVRDTMLLDQGFEKYAVSEGKSGYAKVSSEIVHSGGSSLNIFDGGGSYGRYDLYCTPGYCTSVREAWFYDDGSESGNGATVYFQDPKMLVALTVGAYDAGLDYYTYSNAAGSRASYGAGFTVLSDKSGYKGDCISSGRVSTGIKRKKGWHQVTYVVKPLSADYMAARCTAAGLLTLYLDGVEIFAEKYLPDRVHVVGLRSVAGANLFYDDVIVYNDTLNRPPKVESLEIKGGFSVGETLTADAVITDAEGDEIKPSLYAWEKSQDGIKWQPVSEASSITLDETFIDCFVRLRLTPVSASGEGEEAICEGRVRVSENIDAPFVSDINLSAGKQVGEYMEISYDFTGEQGDLSVISWLVSDDGSVWSVWDTGKRIPITAAIGKKYVKAEIIPQNGYNLEGTPVFSETVKMNIESPSYVVSSGGSDEYGSGSVSNPFKTVGAAVKAVRNDRLSGFDGHVFIYLRGGEYYNSKTIGLTAADCNFTISSYPGERAVITGGVKVDKSRLSKADDEFSRKVIDKTAQAKLLKLDLSGLVDKIPGYGSFVHGGNNADYRRHLQVYVDGVPLEKSRWPNEREDDLVMESVVKDEITGDYTVTYGQTDRPLLWSDRSLSEAVIEGHFNVVWSDAHAPQTGFDPEAASFVIASESCRGSYAPDVDDEFYFHNIIEEIDLPGESWIDREGLGVYFYPPAGFSEDSEIVISLSEDIMIEGAGSTGITVSDIDFTYLRNKIFNFSVCDNIVLDGCRFMHYTVMNTLNGNGNTIRNCYFYDGGQGGVAVSGGSGFSGGQSLIENNVFQSMDTLKMSYSPALNISGYGHTVRKNEIYDAYHQLVTLTGNDHLFEYNDIHHGTKWTGDMGAVYWLAGPASIGHEFRYNYFHDNGSDYANGWSQAMFWDDCQVGPYIHHNIFARATYPYDDGVNPSRRYTLKANGGSYAVITDNIFADCPYPAQFQNNEKNVGINGNNRQQIDFWLRAYGKKESSDETWFNKLKSAGYFTEEWQQHYAGTVWEEYSNLFSLEFYEQNLASLDKTEDKDTLVQIARQYAPENANTFDRNVVFNTYKTEAVYSGSNGIETNTVRVEKQDFEDYDGDNFSLSGSGLSKVREAIPGFQNIGMENIGPDNKEMIVGTAPKAENPTIEFNSWNIVSAEYDYLDADGNHESASEIKWYSAYTPDGDYVYTGFKGKEYLSGSDGMYVKYSITPRDSLGIMGETVFSDPVFVSKGGGLVVKSMTEEKADGNITVNITVENKGTEEKSVLAILSESSVGDIKKLVSCDSEIKTVPVGKFVLITLTIPEGSGEIKTVVLNLDGLRVII